jgi:DNA modification methylase
MEVKRIPVSQINPSPYNPRVDLQPEDPEYQKLKQSINTFGYVDPIIWNRRTGNLVGGHQRFKIFLEQGVKEVKVSVVDLPIEEESFLNLALNKVQGRWDEDKLAEVLEDLSTLPDFDFTLSGFDLPEISQIIDEHIRPKEEYFDFNAEVESISIPITKPGDLINLGKHRLLCGDSGKVADLELLVKSSKINLSYTDVPYNVNYDSESRPTKKNKKKWQKIESDNLKQQDYEEWLKNIFINMGKVLAEGASCYVWNGHRQFYFMHQVLIKLGYHISSVITWAKDNFAMSFSDYNWQTEHCIYFWKDNNGKHNWYGDGKQSNLWYASRDPANLLLHPTQKPVSLAMKAIKNSSRRGDIVLDMFAGSGSTLIAAEEMNRKCYLIEKSPAYCDAIVKRYISFVGKENISGKIRKKYIKEVPDG